MKIRSRYKHNELHCATMMIEYQPVRNCLRGIGVKKEDENNAVKLIGECHDLELVFKQSDNSKRVGRSEEDA